MRILAFDTSNQTMSAALTENYTVIAEKTINIKRNHSIQLMPAIEELVNDAGWSMDSIDRIAVAQGPGSYTGIRIAVTVAKTLAWTAGAELVGISSLKVLAMNAAYLKNQLIVPLFDARRENVYTGLYRTGEDGLVKTVEPDTHIHSKDWAEFLKSFNEPILFVGEDAERFKNIFGEALEDNFSYSLHLEQLPKASVLARLALHEEPADIHTFIPNYLKLAEAEEKWNKEHPEAERSSFVEKI